MLYIFIENLSDFIGIFLKLTKSKMNLRKFKNQATSTVSFSYFKNLKFLNNKRPFNHINKNIFNIILNLEYF